MILIGQVYISSLYRLHRTKWLQFWELPESVEDVFSLFSATDIRRTRDSALGNIETLILAVTSRLNVLSSHPSFPDSELAPERDCLNCIRVLTRLLPFIYETDRLSDWEDTFFWGMRRRRTRRPQLPGEVLFDETQTDGSEQHDEEKYEDARPLAEELIDTLIDLLFYSGFTTPHLPDTRTKVNYAIWQSGIGCKASIGTSKELESNRCEVLRLLLTLASKSMYMSSSVLPVQGVKAVTYMATCQDKQVVLSVLCSLLNTTIKYNATTWRLPYDHVVWKDPKQSLVTYSLQLLLVLLLYPVPEDSQGLIPKNYYRHFLGRLHRPEDFQFLAEGMTRILSQPMQATTTYLPGSQKSVRWAPEMIMLFWEILQCNKRFRSFILESNRAHDFIVLMLFYAIEHKADPTKQGVVRMCVFVLQTMSEEPAFGKNLNEKFEAQETLPASIRQPNFKGSYADFLIISVHTLITGSKGKLDAVYPALLAVVNNLAPYAQHLSMVACSKLVQLFNSTSVPSFLLANDTNHALLQSLLESISAIIEHQYTHNPNLVYTILKSRKRVEALRAFTLESGQQGLEQLGRRRKEGLDSQIDSTATSSPTRSHATYKSRASEEEPSTFAIGDSEESEEDESSSLDPPTPSQSTHSSHQNSRTPSISSTADDNHHGMSDRARGKMPAGRQNSTSTVPDYSTEKPSLTPLRQNGLFTPTPQWLETWLPHLPLHTPLTIIKALAPHLPQSSQRSNATASSSSTAPISQYPPIASPTAQFIRDLPHTATHPQIQPLLSSPSAIKIQTFEFAPLILGWYLSLLYSLIFVAESQVNQATASTLATNVVGGHTGNSGPVGVWNGTGVKLFHVASEYGVDRANAVNTTAGATTAPTAGPGGIPTTPISRKGPSLREPRGAVDAVGRRLVDGVSGLSLAGMRGLMGRAAGTTGSNPTSRASPGQQGGGRQSVREV